MSPRNQLPLQPDSRWLCLIVVGLALVFRIGYTWFLVTPPFDPWRHLSLIRSLTDGNGFTLFADQAYIWYNPVWYYLAAWCKPLFEPEILASLLSAVTVALFFLFLLRLHGDPHAAFWGGALMAVYGPVISYTCHYGAESLALLLLVAALLLATFRDSLLSILLAGLCLGVCLAMRMQYAPAVIMLIPFLTWKRAVLLATAGLAGLLPFWIRNWVVVSEHPFLFTWDGLATPRASFDVMSTLVLPLNDTIREANYLLYSKVLPFPEWIVNDAGIQWGSIAFMITGLVAVVWSKRRELILVCVAFFVAFFVLDRSLSGNFFRHYLPVFVAYFVACSVDLKKLADRTRRSRGYAAIFAVYILMLGGAYLIPRPFLSVEQVSPPREFLEEEWYMTNSGFYHPESLIYNFPAKKFIGLPLRPDEFDAFSASFPQYGQFILWRESFSVQDELLRGLLAAGRYRIIRSARNGIGMMYHVLERV